MACSKMAMGGGIPTNPGGQCSREDGEGTAPKRARGRPAKVGHFHEEYDPTHFAKVIMAPGLDMLPIPDGFRPYLSTVPRTIVLKTNTGCSWMMKLKEISGRICLDQGWPGFAIDHQIKIGFFLTFKMMKGDIFKVTIFDYSMTEVIKKCLEHDPLLAMIED